MEGSTRLASSEIDGNLHNHVDRGSLPGGRGESPLFHRLSGPVVQSAAKQTSGTPAGQGSP